MEERIPSQRFLFPHQLEVTPEDADIILNNESIFKNSGFDVKHRSENTFVINAAPALLLEGEIEKSFLNLIDNIKSEGCDINRERPWRG